MRKDLERLFCLALVGVGLVGCARELEGAPTSFAPAAPSLPADFGFPRFVISRGPASSAIPAGEACLSRLDQLGIRYRRLDERRGVDMPVAVKGPIGGIEYVAGAGLPLEADCRLVLALERVAPVLSAAGVDKLRYSGAYTYRNTRSGRLSLHARGLAIDVHAARAGGKWLSVANDYQAGLQDGCSPSSPSLNRLSCELGRERLFSELLTPDFDADHRDHLHLAISPSAPIYDE